MPNVVSLAEHRPHIAGDAKCLTCNYEWAAVAEVGAVELECPKCKTYKGVFVGMTAPDIVMQCDCGNQHFYIGTDSHMCARCGITFEQ